MGSTTGPDWTVLHEDEFLLVVDKPAGLLVVGAPGRPGPSLVDLLSRARGERLYPVHRLDEDTTGTLLFARDPDTRHALEGMFKAHAVERVYLALVARAPHPAAGKIESRLEEGRDGVLRSVPGTRRGKQAITHYRALERRGRHVLVECRLETGRRNQIRAHMAELGCPVVGDRKYGHRGGGARRPLLHAWKLSLRHPITGARIDVEATAPEPELAPPSDA